MRGFIGTVFGALAAYGCTTLAPSTDTCSDVLCPKSTGQISSTGSSSGSPSPPPPGNWDCLNGLGTQSLPSSSPRVVTYIVPIVDFGTPPSLLSTSTPVIPDLKIQACRSGGLDPAAPVGDAGSVSCLLPLSSMASTPLADAGRPFVYAIPLPSNTDIWLSITASNYIPTAYFFGGQLLGSQDGGPVVQGAAIATLMTETAVGLEQGGGITLDPSKGILALRAVDCDGARAKGVSVRLDDASAMAVGGRGFTLKMDVPKFHDPPDPTDERGVAGFANVGAPYNVDAYGISPEGHHYGDVTVRVNPGQFTLVDIRPSSIVPQ
jgi:hypothetical protein